jgi:hypothetical protein
VVDAPEENGLVYDTGCREPLSTSLMPSRPAEGRCLLTKAMVRLRIRTMVVVDPRLFNARINGGALLMLLWGMGQ